MTINDKRYITGIVALAFVVANLAMEPLTSPVLAVLYIFGLAFAGYRIFKYEDL